MSQALPMAEGTKDLQSCITYCSYRSVLGRRAFAVDEICGANARKTLGGTEVCPKDGTVAPVAVLSLQFREGDEDCVLHFYHRQATERALRKIVPL